MSVEPLRVPFTTEDIRSVVAWQDNYPYAGEHNESWAADFDRWLAEHDRQVAEKALREAALYLREPKNGERHAAADIVLELVTEPNVVRPEGDPDE